MKRLFAKISVLLALTLLCLLLPLSAGAVEQPVLSPRYPTVSFEGAIEYNIYFSVSNMADVEEMGLITVASLEDEGTIETALTVSPGAIYDNGLYVARTLGIPAKNLGDTLYFRIYACLTDGSYVYSKTCDYSILAYAHTLLTTPSTPETMRDLVSEMLNYGTAAQNYFNYRTDLPANRGLVTGGHIYDDVWVVQTPPELDKIGTECCYCILCQAEPLTRDIPALSVSGLTVTAQPDKTKYYSGESFDATGLTVTANLSDGSSQIITDYTLDKKVLTVDDTEVIVDFRGYTAAIPITVSPYEKVSVSELNRIAEGTQVVVEGYVAGVAEEGPSADRELLLKDTQTDDIIAVRNVTYGSFPDYGYEIGDLLNLIVTPMTDTTVNTPNKPYLNFSEENGEQSETILSTGHELTYCLDQVITIDSWEQMQNLFAVGAVKDYSYIQINGPIWINRYSGSDGVDVSRLHLNTAATGVSGIRTDGSRTVSFRDNVMSANLGESWSDLFFETMPTNGNYPGTRLHGSVTAIYTGGNNYYFQLTVLDESWVELKQFDEQEALVTVAESYYRQGTQIQYDQSERRRNLNVAPEAATAEATVYLDCSSFVNAVYQHTFGVNVMNNDEVPSTEKFTNYCVNGVGTLQDVIGYWVNQDYTTDDRITAVLKEVREQLQIGDILVYRHGETAGTSGHTYVYVGDDTFLHCTGSSYSYQDIPSDSVDKGTTDEKTLGSIQKIHADEIFTNTASKRYLFKVTSSDTVYNFCLLRPLNRGLTISEAGKNRVRMGGMDIQLQNSVGQYQPVCVGDTITYTLTMTNPSESRVSQVPVSVTLPEGTAFVSSDSSMTLTDNVLTWQGNVSAGATVIISWTLKVEGNATLVTEGNVGEIPMNVLTNTVSTFTAQQLSVAASKAFELEGSTYVDPMNFVNEVYSSALGIEISNGTAQAALNDLIDTTNDTCHTSTDLSRLIVPDLYGGRDIKNGFITDCSRIRLVQQGYLAVGDVIVAEYDGVYEVFLYLGEGQLAKVSSADGICAVLTSSGDEFSGTNIFTTFIAYDRYAIIRPSQAG